MMLRLFDQFVDFSMHCVHPNPACNNCMHALLPNVYQLAIHGELPGISSLDSHWIDCSSATLLHSFLASMQVFFEMHVFDVESWDVRMPAELYHTLHFDHID